jgi:endonuclease YncB( thermonuclease family)
MKKFLSIISFLFIVSALFAAGQVKTITGTVVKISDGDTITISDVLQTKTKVRFYGIDAPESKQAFGQEAKFFLDAIIGGKKVDVVVYDIDRYGRSVGIVMCSGKNINKEMVKSGYAWVYAQYHKLPDRNEWLNLQESAKAQKIGLWQNENCTAPWAWRKAAKNKHTATAKALALKK